MRSYKFFYFTRGNRLLNDYKRSFKKRTEAYQWATDQIDIYLAGYCEVYESNKKIKVIKL